MLAGANIMTASRRANPATLVAAANPATLFDCNTIIDRKGPPDLGWDDDVSVDNQQLNLAAT